MKKIILFLVASIGMIACNNDDCNNFQNQNIEFMTIAEGNNHNFYETSQQEQYLVFTDSDSFNSFLELAGSEHFIETDVNFEQYDVVAVLDQFMGSVCFINITSIQETQSHRIVKSNRTVTIASAVSRPYHVVKIPKSNKPIAFEQTTNM